jgi:hypothetical protein
MFIQGIKERDIVAMAVNDLLVYKDSFDLNNIG